MLINTLKDFIFHEGSPPQDYMLEFEESLFNTYEYRILQSQTGWHSFYILIAAQKKISAAIHFHVLDNVAQSPLRAPFGSFEISATLPPEIVIDFITFIQQRLRAMNIIKLIIKNPPDLYDVSKSSVIQTLLFNHGFAVGCAELSSVIPIQNREYSELIHPRKKRNLQQAQNKDLEFRNLDHQHINEVYDFILCCRIQKEMKLSMTLQDLSKVIAVIKERYLLFGVYHFDKLVAASIVVKVNNGVLYHFMSDHIRRVETMSPGLVLMQGIYQHCFANKISLLDLGTSAANSKPNFKLIRFKTETGGILSSKLTYVKDFTL